MAQKNEGKWAFTLQEEGGTLVLDVDLGRGVLTSEIRGEVHPNLVRMLVKVPLLLLSSSVPLGFALEARRGVKGTGHMHTLLQI